MPFLEKRKSIPFLCIPAYLLPWNRLFKECFRMSSIKKICLCAICTALCYVLPLAFHPLVMGTALSPMHIPVLLCGLLCGWPYGAFCGVEMCIRDKLMPW